MSAPQIFDLKKKIEELENEIEELKSKTLTQAVRTTNTDLNDYIEDGTYYFATSYTPSNIPVRCKWMAKSNITWWYRSKTDLV